MLNIVVCVKEVPDPKEACNTKIDPHTKTLMRCDVPQMATIAQGVFPKPELDEKRTGEILPLDVPPDIP